MKKVAAFGALATTALTIVPQAFAAITVDPCPRSDAGTNFFTLCNLQANGAIIQNIITIAFIIAALIALGFLIFGGIKWIMSGGDKGGVEAARNMIVAAVVGLIIVFASYIIINLVFGLFNLGSFGNFRLPSLTAGVSRNSSGSPDDRNN